MASVFIDIYVKALSMRAHTHNARQVQKSVEIRRRRPSDNRRPRAHPDKINKRQVCASGFAQSVAADFNQSG